MSLRDALKSKFRGNKSTDSTSPERVKSENEVGVLSYSSGKQKVTPLSRIDYQTRGSGAEAAIIFDEDSVEDTDEKTVYEVQLEQLQQQLLDAMIDNQHLAAELKTLKEKNHVDQIQRDLQFERERNKELASEIEKLNARNREPSERSQGDTEQLEWVDVAQEALEDIGIQEEIQPLSWSQKITRWFMGQVYELLEDFSTDPEPEDNVVSDDTELAVVKLKDNISRFKNGLRPVVRIIQGVSSLLTWQSIAYTFLVFLVYMYAVWRGFLLPVVLFMALVILGINYLKNRGWNIHVEFLSPVEEEDHTTEAEENQDLGMKDKFNLVVKVAIQAQNLLGKVADGLEKIKNLLTWKHPDAAGKLFFVLFIALILSSVLPGPTLFMIVALYMGIKFFIIEYLYVRFPRLRRHDTTHKMWLELPTDTELTKRNYRSEINRQIQSLNSGQQSTDEVIDLSNRDKTFCDLFSLPFSEKPLPGWQGGRRCALIDKDKSLLSSIKQGKLYLTRSFLCFERNNVRSSSHIILALADITGIYKAKPLSWMPGRGMSLDVAVKGFEKPYTFGAILNRDECYTRLLAHARRAKLDWAVQSSSGTDVTTATDEQQATNQQRSSSATGTDSSAEPKSDMTFRMSELEESSDLDESVYKPLNNFF